VRQNESAGPHQRQQAVQVVDVALLVGIEEEYVEGLLQARDGLVRVAFDDGHQLADARFTEMFAGGGGPPAVILERRQPAAGLVQGQTEPHSRNAGGGADLDDVFGAAGFRQQAKHAPVGRRHVGVGGARPPRLFDHAQNSLLVFGTGQRQALCRGASCHAAEATAEAPLAPGKAEGSRQPEQCISPSHGFASPGAEFPKPGGPAALSG
jgi:hypothetical protein